MAGPRLCSTVRLKSAPASPRARARSAGRPAPEAPRGPELLRPPPAKARPPGIAEEKTRRLSAFGGPWRLSDTRGPLPASSARRGLQTPGRGGGKNTTGARLLTVFGRFWASLGFWKCPEASVGPQASRRRETRHDECYFAVSASRGGVIRAPGTSGNGTPREAGPGDGVESSGDHAVEQKKDV